MGLTSEQITDLLKINEGGFYKAPQQYGPLRWVDKSMRCASRGCGSTTYCKVEGIPRCMMHALQELNEMLTEVTDGTGTV